MQRGMSPGEQAGPSVELRKCEWGNNWPPNTFRKRLPATLAGRWLSLGTRMITYTSSASNCQWTRGQSRLAGAVFKAANKKWNQCMEAVSAVAHPASHNRTPKPAGLVLAQHAAAVCRTHPPSQCTPEHPARCGQALPCPQPQTTPDRISTNFENAVLSRKKK